MDLRSFSAVLLLFSILEFTRGAGDWNYVVGDAHGPANWGNDYSVCAGQRQSPVDIVLSNVQYDATLGEINFVGYDTAQPNTEFHINNNGHAVGVSLKYAENVVPPEIKISGGGLPGSFSLAQFHFHWGQDDTHGSEHHTDGTPYAAELHLVHSNDAYYNLSEAVTYPDGLAVLGIHMLVSGDEAHSGFTGFTEYLANITYKGNSTDVPEYAIDRMLPEDKTTFYRYEGSLTTPPCNEAVIWTVFKDPVTISHDQMAEFRKVLDNNEEPINNNYRPAQPLYTRVIYRSFEPRDDDQDGDSSRSSPVQTILLPLLITSFFIAFLL